jgi:hypothetical protein
MMPRFVTGPAAAKAAEASLNVSWKCHDAHVATPEQYLTDASLRDVPYGPGKVAKHVGGDLWEIYYDVPGRARRLQGTAMTEDVRAHQRAGSVEADRLERILADLG